MSFLYASDMHPNFYMRANIEMFVVEHFPHHFHFKIMHVSGFQSTIHLIVESYLIY